MSNHSIIKTGVGIGLMAASLASLADIHTFAEPTVYYKVNGSAVNYVALLPNLRDTGVLALELFQSGSISSWAFAVGGSVDANAGGVVWSYTLTTGAQPASNSLAVVNYAGSKYDAGGNLVTYGINNTQASTGSSTAGSSWYGGGSGSVSLAFIQSQTISSQACNVTFTVNVGADDVLRYSGFSLQPDGWTTASAAVVYRTLSGTTTSDTANVASAAWNAMNFSATSNFPTFSAFTIPNAAAGAGQTVAVSALTKANLCTNIYTTKNALNSAGNVIGGVTGLVRLW